MKKDKQLCVALETRTYERLQELADMNDSPVGRVVRQIIKMYMKGIDDGIFCMSVYRTPNACPKSIALPDTVKK